MRYFKISSIYGYITERVNHHLRLLLVRVVGVLSL